MYHNSVLLLLLVRVGSDNVNQRNLRFSFVTVVTTTDRGRRLAVERRINTLARASVYKETWPLPPPPPPSLLGL